MPFFSSVFLQPFFSQSRALSEFDGVASLLRSRGVWVRIFEDRDEDQSPDAIFPGDWLSTHESGEVRRCSFIMSGVNYVILQGRGLPNEGVEATCREARGHRGLLERDLPGDSFSSATQLNRFEFSLSKVTNVIDLGSEAASSPERFLEGSGSIVFDRVTSRAFACISPRTDKALAGSLARKYESFSLVLLTCSWDLFYLFRLGYELVSFTARDGTTGAPVFHTNVMMWAGTRAAAVCLDAINSDQVRDEFHFETIPSFNLLIAGALLRELCP